MTSGGSVPTPYRDPDPHPVLLGKIDNANLTRQLLTPIWNGSKLYRPLFLATGIGTLFLFTMLFYTAFTGIGLWGNNIPVAWAFAITNFVWWIGIGHAGTFISAFLLLLEQKWRTSINRFSEAMTLFAVMNAGLFPLIHLGRPWFFYWLAPYPPTMRLWPQFRSALPWDMAAVSTYFTISLLFWYLGLIPDLAVMRDTAARIWQRRIYGIFALGWRGTSRDWSHFRVSYGLLGALATPLVVSVHSVVSMDFATAQLPGWHSAIFPPYFVAGAIYSGFAMVLTLLIPARRLFNLYNVVTATHLNNMAKMLIATGWIVTYSYIVEIFIGWYSGDIYERYVHLVSRPTGPYAVLYWILIVCNCGTPQVLWFKRVRASPVALWIASIVVNIGMWVERFVLIVSSLNRDFLPSSWHNYTPTVIDGSIFCGTLCFFLFLFLLFMRFVPFIPLTELKELKHEIDERAAHGIPQAEVGNG